MKDRLEDEWTQLGDRIDRLMTLEFRPARGSVPAGLVLPLYNACRTAQGEPLSTAAADLLLSRKGDGPVMLVTGAGIAPALPRGETDGPPGAAYLAETLVRTTRTDVVFVSEADHIAAVRNCSEVIGGAHPVESFPALIPEASTRHAQDLLERYRPSAVVFVERDGANPEGRYHGVRGNCRPAGSVARADSLATEARRVGIPTLGIGDGGNEVGFGGIRDAVAALMPGGADCLAECAAGRVTSVSTDVCLSASVSNWGAYGVATAIACATGRVDLLPPPERDTRLVEACVRAGTRDGATGIASDSVDGVSRAGNLAVLTLLHELAGHYTHGSASTPVIARHPTP